MVMVTVDRRDGRRVDHGDSRARGLHNSLFIIVIAVTYIIPRLFNQVVKLRNREVFILTIVLVCLDRA